MERFKDFSLYAQNFKCFGAPPQGFKTVRRLNLVIGRNNTGKSALLDLVRYAVKPYDLSPYAYKQKSRSSVIIHGILDEPLVKRFFRSDTAEGGIDGNHQEYGLQFLGAKM